MLSDAGPPAYRIERRESGELALYRGDVLFDVDREDERDSRIDIERWGSMVSWVEDHTIIERWDQLNPGKDWRILVGVPRPPRGA